MHVLVFVVVYVLWRFWLDSQIRQECRKEIANHCPPQLEFPPEFPLADDDEIQNAWPPMSIAECVAELEKPYAQRQREWIERADYYNTPHVEVRSWEQIEAAEAAERAKTPHGRRFGEYYQDQYN
jgi:hypothetical protein